MKRAGQLPRGQRRVLIVDQSGELGGAELSLLPIAVALRGRAEVVLLSEGAFRARLERGGVSVSVLANARLSAIRKEGLHPGKVLAALTALPRLIQQICALAAKARGCQLMLLNTQKALVLGALAKTLAGTPVLFHLRDMMTREHFGRVQLAIVRFVMRRWVDFVIANSQATADSLRQLTALPAERMAVIYNGIDAAPFDAITDDRALLRRRANLPEGVFLIGVFGRLAPWKGQHIALHALAQLPNAQLAIVGGALFGNEAYEAELRRCAIELGVAPRVHFLGFQDNVPALMKAMDAVIHTSTAAEPFGRVIVEAMLARRPVIATAMGGVLEIISDGVTGLLIAPNDPPALAAALDRLQRDPSLGAALAARGYQQAVTRFGLKAYVDTVIGCLDAV